LNERIVGTKPSSLSYAEAAALPLTTLTAWELFDRLQVAQDDTSKSILVIAAAGV
jgi:NADPH:quinone reductase-like Zn-dependent oxidoreductase